MGQLQLSAHLQAGNRTTCGQVTSHCAMRTQLAVRKKRLDSQGPPVNEPFNEEQRPVAGIARLVVFGAPLP